MKAETSQSSVVEAFLRDALRFTLRFRHMLEVAPLQIYSAGLVFAPDASIIYKTFCGSTSKWIELLSKREPHWSACRSTLEGHLHYVKAVTFSPDGQLVASASCDTTVRAWETSTGTCRSTLDGRTGVVHAVAFSLDGLLMASASRDSTVFIWDTRTWSHLATFEGHSDAVSTVAFSPDLLPDNRVIVSGSLDGTVKLWELSMNSRCVTLHGHKGAVHAVAISPDGQVIASASDDNTVRLWDRATMSCRKILHCRFRTLAFMQDGQLLGLVRNGGSHTIRIWNIATEPEPRILVESAISIRDCEDIAVSPAGRLIAANTPDGIHIYSADTGSACSMLQGCSGTFETVGFSLDGRLVAAATATSVQLWDVSTDYCNDSTELRPEYVYALASSPNDQLLVSVGDEVLQLWNATTGACFRVLEHSIDEVEEDRVFSPDGQLMTCRGRDPIVHLCNTMTWSWLRLKGHSAKIRSVSFSPYNQLLASASEDGTIRLWNTTTGSCCSIYECHPGSVYSLCFSLDCRLIASISKDGTVRLWNLADNMSTTCRCCNG